MVRQRIAKIARRAQRLRRLRRAAGPRARLVASAGLAPQCSYGAEVTGFVPDGPQPPPIVVNDDTVLLSGEPGTVPITYFVPGDNSLGDTWAAVGFDDAAWSRVAASKGTCAL